MNGQEKILKIDGHSNDNKGRCSLCGIIGQGSRDFLCENCADPNTIIIYCSNCQEKIHLSDVDKNSPTWQFFTKLPEFPNFTKLKGISIKVSWCPICQLGKKFPPLDVFVYKLK